MNFSEETSNIIYRAIEYSHEKGYEYVTPEILLLMILDNGIFSEAFENCGGSTEMLRDYLKEYAEEYIDRADTEKPEFSDGVNALLNIAARSAYNSGSKEVCLRHLIHGLWQLDDCYAVYFIEKQGISEADLLQEMAVTEEVLSEIGEKAKNEDSDEAQSGWKLYAPCLNETLTDVNPLIGRQAELDRTIQILCRKDKNNPLHIGEPGVGKTALTYGLVQLIRKGDIPEPLKDAKVFALDLGGMLAGTQYRGDFEKRFKKVLAEIGKEQSPIIYIDEIHNLSGAGAVGEGSFDASNMLKPYLSDGKIRFIGATTFEEYKKYF
ncbi:MAG TPA: AAA family ATPase, partial [Ruminococcus flavefaciens]|nr:AAA family ATPase [Ruminococcus flavefaciens]